MQAEQLLDALKEQFNVPTSLIQEQDVLLTPVLLWQRAHHQHPPGVIQRACLQLRWFLLRFALGSALGFLLLLLAQTQDHQTQLDLLAWQSGSRQSRLLIVPLRVQAPKPSQQIDHAGSPLIDHREVERD